LYIAEKLILMDNITATYVLGGVIVLVGSTLLTVLAEYCKEKGYFRMREPALKDSIKFRVSLMTNKFEEIRFILNYPNNAEQWLIALKTTIELKRKKIAENWKKDKGSFMKLWNNKSLDDKQAILSVLLKELQQAVEAYSDTKNISNLITEELFLLISKDNEKEYNNIENIIDLLMNDKYMEKGNGSTKPGALIYEIPVVAAYEISTDSDKCKVNRRDDIHEYLVILRKMIHVLFVVQFLQRYSTINTKKKNINWRKHFGKSLTFCTMGLVLTLIVEYKTTITSFFQGIMS